MQKSRANPNILLGKYVQQLTETCTNIHSRGYKRASTE